MHWPEKLFRLYTLLTIVLVGKGLYESLNSSNHSDPKFAFEIFIFCSIFAVILGSIKTLFVCLEKTNKTGLLEKCRFNRSFGCFMIIIFGIAARIIAFFGDMKAAQIWATISITIASISYLVFVAGTHKYCTWDKTVTKRITKWVVSIHTALLVVSLFLIRVFCEDSDPYGRNKHQRELPYLYQIGFFGVCLAGTQEMVELYFGALQLKEEYENEEVKLEIVKVKYVIEEEKEVREKKSVIVAHWPENLFQLYTLAAIIVAGFGLHKLLSSSRHEREEAFVNFIICLIFTLILGSMKTMFVLLEKTNKTGLLEKCNFNRSFGFFLIVICGIAQRIIPFFLTMREYEFLSSIILIIANISYFLFVFGTHKYCTWDNNVIKKIAKWNISIQAIILLVLLFLINQFCQDSYYSWETTGSRRLHLYLYQIGFFGMCLAGVQEIVEVYFGAMKLKKNEEKEGVKLESVKVEKMIEMKKETRKEKLLVITHWPENLFQLYTLATIIAVGFGLYKFHSNPGWYEREAAFAIFIACLIFTFIVGSLKVMLGSLGKINKTGLLEKCNLNLSFGFFLIVICGIAPRIIPFFVDMRDASVYAILFLMFANISYFLFVFGTHQCCSWDKDLTRKIAKWVVPVHVGILIFSLFLINQFCRDSYYSIYEGSGSRRLHLYLYQIAFSGLSLVGIQEIVAVYLGALKLKKNDENSGMKLESVKVEETEEVGKEVALSQAVVIDRETTSTLPENNESNEEMDWIKV